MTAFPFFAHPKIFHALPSKIDDYLKPSLKIETESDSSLKISSSFHSLHSS
jgi:hypothetical protein